MFFFFFQAEDGIRDSSVTGVQTCALPISPVSTHFALAKAALEAGKHVLVEKPLCRSLAEGEELLALSRAQNKLLCVGHVFLFNNAVRGEIGRASCRERV